MASTTTETPDVVFYGKDGTEAEDFIRAVRKWGFAAGKLGDNDVLAQFASTCFAGAALRWYETLDKATRGNWDALKEAILLQYPHLDQNNVPTPAASLPRSNQVGVPHSSGARSTDQSVAPWASSLSSIYTPPQNPNSSNIVAGRIRFICENPAYSGYLVPPLASPGLFLVEPNKRTAAMIVQVDTSIPMQPLKIRDASRFPDMPNLGLIWYNGVPEWGSVTDKGCVLCLTSQDLQQKSVVGRRGPTQISAWTYNSEGELQVHWLGKDNQLPQLLEVAVYTPGGGFQFMPNFAKFVEAGRRDFAKGRLVLELEH